MLSFWLQVSIWHLLGPLEVVLHEHNTTINHKSTIINMLFHLTSINQPKFMYLSRWANKKPVGVLGYLLIELPPALS